MSGRWAERRVVVTGGSAFSGSFLAERLVALGARVRVPLRIANHHVAFPGSDRIDWMVGDVSDPGFAARLLRDADELIHFASFRRNVAFHREHRDEVFAKNTAMTEALIGALPAAGIPVTFASSALVGTKANDQREGTVGDGYIAAKLHCERAWSHASRVSGFPLLMVRPVSIYGPRDTFAADGNVFPSLIIRAAHETKELVVWGSGRQERSFVYAPDVMEATLMLLQEGITGTEYICPPVSATIAELAAAIRDIVHPGLSIRFDASKPEGPSLPPFPVHPLLLSYPWMEIREGLRRTVEWYKTVR